MAKIRVHELAKQLGKDSKEIVARLISHNIEVKNHMSSITEEQAHVVMDSYEKPGGGKASGKDGFAKKDWHRKSGEQREGDRKAGDTSHPDKSGAGKSHDNKSHAGKSHADTSHPDKSHPDKSGSDTSGVAKPHSDAPAAGKSGAGKSHISGLYADKSAGGSGKFAGEKPKQSDRQSAGGKKRNDPNRSDNVRDGKDNGGKKNSHNHGSHSSNSSNNNHNNNNNTAHTGGNAHNGSSNSSNNRGGRDNRDRNKKSHITQVYNPQNSGMGRTGNNNGGGKQNASERKNTLSQPKPQPIKEDKIKSVILSETMTIQELADKIKIQASAMIKKLFMEGKMYTLNQEINYETAAEIALEYDVIAEPEEKIDVIEQLLREEEEDESLLVPRPPVVCVMGHVDHGKTSLLDAIRKTNVISGEAGGITQHIGAYVVEAGGHKITFLDTPGHEAFTAMRMRGAQSTDIAILVVAADDGVMPQTVEAISHAKAAGVSTIVAVNKIDKAGANIDRVKQELAEYELVAEDWGGDTIFVPVSAHTGEGLDTLLEMINLTAEMCELKSNPDRKARGLVLEAKLDKGKGPVATVLVQKGTLRIGDNVAAGACHGKVRAMMNDKNERINEAGPSVPVEILGLDNVPNAGEVLIAANNDKEARNIAETFISEGRERLLENSKAKSRMSLDDLFSQIQSGDVKELNLIVKADVQGSVEAVKQSLMKLSNEEVVVKIIHGGVGAINESDVSLASASNAIIIGFNVRPDNTAKEIADREHVDVRLYRVIYQAIEDVEAAMKGMLDPIYEEKIIGHAEVRQLFKASGVGTIAGSYVLDGNIIRHCKVRITREGNMIFEGELASLKRFKDDVKEVRTGYECGLVIENFNALEEGDMVEAYVMEEVKR